VVAQLSGSGFFLYETVEVENWFSLDLSNRSPIENFKQVF